MDSNNTINIINDTSLTLMCLSPKYICNMVLYLCIFFYITHANLLLHLFFPLMITNAIMGTILIIFYWNRMVSKYINEYTELNDYINKLPKSIIALRIICVIIHWLPVIIFLMLDIMKTSPLSAISAWVGSLIFILIYILVLIKNGILYELYGKGKTFGYMFIIYPILLFIICQILYMK